MSTTGRCLCRAVTFAFEGPPKWVVHCHCESCRRNCSAPFTTFVGVRDGAWRWTGAAPASYASSPGVERMFCARCGTPMAFRGEKHPGEMHFYAAALDDPGSAVPQGHVFFAEKLPWVHLADDLPRR